MQWEISHFDYTFVFNWAVPKRVVVGGGGGGYPPLEVQYSKDLYIIFSYFLAVWQFFQEESTH